MTSQANTTGVSSVPLGPIGKGAHLFRVVKKRFEKFKSLNENNFSELFDLNSDSEMKILNALSEGDSVYIQCEESAETLKITKQR